MFRCSLAFIALLSLSISARAGLVVTPAGNVSVEGNRDNGFPFNLGALDQPSTIRYQQFYTADAFSGLAPGGEFITQILFRPGAQDGAAFASILPDIQINLSTSTRGPTDFSTTFDSNVGLDNTVVYGRGALALASGFTGPAGGPKAFDILITLTTPFFYNPANGNLLLDIRNFGGGTTTFFDAQSSASDSVFRLYSNTTDPNNVYALSATGYDTIGLVTEFVTVVPEPGTWALTILGGGIALALLRKKLFRGA